MPLLRMTTRRWMVAVTVVASLTGSALAVRRLEKLSPGNQSSAISRSL